MCKKLRLCCHILVTRNGPLHSGSSAESIAVSDAGMKQRCKCTVGHRGSLGKVGSLGPGEETDRIEDCRRRGKGCRDTVVLIHAPGRLNFEGVRGMHGKLGATYPDK